MDVHDPINTIASHKQHERLDWWRKKVRVYQISVVQSVVVVVVCVDGGDGDAL